MTRGYLPAPGDVRPSAVRRAAAYVDAHLSLPITIRDAADAAGTSPHALRAAFRQHLGTSFRAYLRRAGCAAARQDLEGVDQPAAADDPAMHEIAARWGFTCAADLQDALVEDRPGR